MFEFSGQGVALGMTDDQIRRQEFSHLADLEKIHALEDLRLFGQCIASDIGDGIFQFARVPPEAQSTGLDPDFGQKSGHADHLILFAIDHGPFSEDILMAVYIGVDQAAPLAWHIFRALASRSGSPAREKTRPSP